MFIVTYAVAIVVIILYYFIYLYVCCMYVCMCVIFFSFKQVTLLDHHHGFDACPMLLYYGGKKASDLGFTRKFPLSSEQYCT